MKRILFTLMFVLAPAARAQDMPLSQILIDGEKWKPITSSRKEPVSNEIRISSPDGSTEYLWKPDSLDFILARQRGAATDIPFTPYCPLRTIRGWQPYVTALATDKDGRIYAATALGIQVFDPIGRLCGVMEAPGTTGLQGLRFEDDRLVGWIGDQKYARKLNTTGVAAAATQDKKLRAERKTYDFKDAGKEMEYALFVPTSYDKSKKYPLVIALHGLGGNPQQFMRTRGLMEQAEKRGYIVAAPMGYNERGWYGVRGLKGKNMDPENLGELSEKDVMNVLGIVKNDYSVDPDRVYLMGHSMGGGGSWHLGIKHAGEWAALAPIAPAIFSRNPTELEKIKSTPVILVQGDKDVLVPVAGARRWAEQMKKLEMTHEYIEVKDGNHGNVVGENIPKIFEFFDQHKRKAKKDEK